MSASTLSATSSAISGVLSAVSNRTVSPPDEKPRAASEASSGDSRTRSPLILTRAAGPPSASPTASTGWPFLVRGVRSFRT